MDADGRAHYAHHVIDSIAVDNLDTSFNDKGVAWNRVTVANEARVENSRFRSMPELLILHDKANEKFWLNIIQWSPFNWAELYGIRIEVREDGSIKARDIINNPEPFGMVTPAPNEEGIRSLSVLELDGRIWLFMGWPGKCVSWSCPVPTDGKLPSNPSAWTVNSSEITLDKGNTFWTAVKVPGTFVDG